MTTATAVTPTEKLIADRYDGLMHEACPGDLQERLDEVIRDLGAGVSRQIGDDFAWLEIDRLEATIRDWIIDHALAVA